MRVFWQNHTFDVDREDEESEKAWHSYNSRELQAPYEKRRLVQKNRNWIDTGFITLEDSRSAGLSPSIHTQGRQVYSVAAYHQLHYV